MVTNLYTPFYQATVEQVMYGQEIKRGGCRRVKVVARAVAEHWQ